MLELQGLPYDQPAIPELTEWKTSELKASLEFGQLPLYEEVNAEGKVERRIVQSNAIYRYLARKFDLYGSNEDERVRCDIIQEAFYDSLTELGKMFWDKDYASKKAAWEEDHLRKNLRYLEAFFKVNNNPKFWVGNALTFADVLMWFYFDSVRYFSPKVFADFPSLVEFKKHFEEIPQITAYLASDRLPKTWTVSLASFGGKPEDLQQ